MGMPYVLAHKIEVAKIRKVSLGSSEVKSKGFVKCLEADPNGAPPLVITSSRRLIVCCFT